MTYLGTYLATSNGEIGPLYCVGLFAALMFLAIFISFFIEEDLRRVKLSINESPE